MDLRTHKKVLGLTISNPTASYNELLGKVSHKSKTSKKKSAAAAITSTHAATTAPTPAKGPTWRERLALLGHSITSGSQTLIKKLRPTPRLPLPPEPEVTESSAVAAESVPAPSTTPHYVPREPEAKPAVLDLTTAGGNLESLLDSIMENAGISIEPVSDTTPTENTSPLAGASECEDVTDIDIIFNDSDESVLHSTEEETAIEQSYAAGLDVENAVPSPAPAASEPPPIEAAPTLQECIASTATEIIVHTEAREELQQSGDMQELIARPSEPEPLLDLPIFGDPTDSSTAEEFMREDLAEEAPSDPPLAVLISPQPPQTHFVFVDTPPPHYTLPVPTFASTLPSVVPEVSSTAAAPVPAPTLASIAAPPEPATPNFVVYACPPSPETLPIPLPQSELPSVISVQAEIPAAEPPCVSIITEPPAEPRTVEKQLEVQDIAPPSQSDVSAEPPPWTATAPSEELQETVSPTADAPQSEPAQEIAHARAAAPTVNFNEIDPLLEECYVALTSYDHTSIELTSAHIQKPVYDEHTKLLFDLAYESFEDSNAARVLEIGIVTSDQRHVEAGQLERQLDRVARISEVPQFTLKGGTTTKPAAAVENTVRERPLRPVTRREHLIAAAIDLAAVVLISAALTLAAAEAWELSLWQMMMSEGSTEHTGIVLPLGIFFAAMPVSWLLYSALTLLTLRATLGMRHAQLMLRTSAGHVPPRSQLVIRAFSLPLSSFLFGFMQLWRHRPAIHDEASDTYLRAFSEQ